MATTASPTPLHAYGNGNSTRSARYPSSSRPMSVRRDSPLSATALASSQGGFASGAMPLRSMNVGDESNDDDDDDDDLQPPPQLSALGRSVLEQHGDVPDMSALALASISISPRNGSNSSSGGSGSGNGSGSGSSSNPHRSTGQTRMSKLRISRDPAASGSKTPPKQDSTTPAPSIRVKRVGLQGAPVRRARRTPQSEEEPPAFETSRYEQQAAQDQENLPLSIKRPETVGGRVKPDPGSTMKPEGVEKMHVVLATRERADKAVPLAAISVNTPHRPAPPPPPPPKMSVLETATAAGGAASTKRKSRRVNIVVNGKSFSQIQRCGRGGSADVIQVMAENGKMFALKKVKLDQADESAIAGYKGEIDLLRKLQDVDRVVKLYDYQVLEEKQLLYVLMELGEADFRHILSRKFDGPAIDSSADSSVAAATELDLAFVRFWWKEMLSCVAAVHEKDIVHSDLKPANFLLIQGGLKLIDFGIANAIDVEHTVNVHRDSHVGTPNYMSPESLQDSSVTGQQSHRNPNGQPQHVGVGKLMKIGKPSDVWSLGCILYQMVYGRPPFAHIPNTLQRAMAIINPAVAIAFPSTGIGGNHLPPELRRTLRACLNRDPTARPTAERLLDSQDAWLHPDMAADLRIPEELLGQIIWRVAERFRDQSKAAPTDEEINQYAGSFYSKIREWSEGGS